MVKHENYDNVVVKASRVAKDGKPIQILDFRSNPDYLVILYHNKTWNVKTSLNRVIKGNPPKYVALKDIPYIIVNGDIYPVASFKLFVSKELLLSEHLGNDFNLGESDDYPVKEIISSYAGEDDQLQQEVNKEFFKS